MSDPGPPEELTAATPATPPQRGRARRRRRSGRGRAREMLLLRPPQPQADRSGWSCWPAFLVVAAVGPVLTDHGPTTTSGRPAQPPSAEYRFGTTTFGQDVFAQFVHGLRSTFLVGLLGGGLAALIGHDRRLHRRLPRRAGRRGPQHVTNVVLVIPTLAVLLICPPTSGPGRAPRGHLHRAHLLAVGGPGGPGPDVLAAHPRVRRPGPAAAAPAAGPIIIREIAPNMSSYLFMTLHPAVRRRGPDRGHPRLHRARPDRAASRSG